LKYFDHKCVSICDDTSLSSAVHPPPPARKRQNSDSRARCRTITHVTRALAEGGGTSLPDTLPATRRRGINSGASQP